MQKEIGRALLSCAIVLMMLDLAACARPRSYSETQAETCRAWRDSLFRPSVHDTAQTAEWLTLQHKIEAAACPDFPPR